MTVSNLISHILEFSKDYYDVKDLEMLEVEEILKMMTWEIQKQAGLLTEVELDHELTRLGMFDADAIGSFLYSDFS